MAIRDRTMDLVAAPEDKTLELKQTACYDVR
jgi:hypothetical protein